LAVGVASGAATVGAVAFETPTDPDQALDARNLLLEPGGALTGLLNAVRGRAVEIATGVETHRGRVIGIDEVNGGTAAPRRQLTLHTEAGTITLVDLADVRSLDFLEAPSRDDLAYLIDRSRAATAGENCVVNVQINGATDDLRVSYVVPAPMWRVSYRLVGDGDDAVTLMAMAIVHNPVDEELEDVELTLTTGQPVSFDIDLYHGKWVRRTVVEEQDRMAGPPTHYAAAGLGSAGLDGVMPAPMGAMDIAVGSYEDDLADGTDRGEHFEYRLAAPISLKRGGAAMAPMLVARLAEGRRERIWRVGSAPNPDIVLAFDNTTGVVLEEGPAVVYDGGSYAGEAMVPFTARGAGLRLAFAKDLAVRCSRTTSSSITTSGVRLGDDALIEEQRHDESHSLRAENDGDAPVVVIFELPMRQGFTLSPDAPKPFEQTASHHRFRVEVPAHGAADLVVGESRPRHRRTEYYELAPDRLHEWLGERMLDARTFRALSGVLAHWHEADDLEDQRTALVEERDQLFEAQARIAEQLKVLRDAGPEGAVRQRNVAQLDALQIQAANIEGEIRRLQAAAEAARGAATTELKRVIGKRAST
jgi:hypothetical protein